MTEDYQQANLLYRDQHEILLEDALHAMRDRGLGLYQIQRQIQQDIGIITSITTLARWCHGMRQMC